MDSHGSPSKLGFMPRSDHEGRPRSDHEGRRRQLNWTFCPMTISVCCTGDLTHPQQMCQWVDENSLYSPRNTIAFILSEYYSVLSKYLLRSLEILLRSHEILLPWNNIAWPRNFYCVLLQWYYCNEIPLRGNKILISRAGHKMTISLVFWNNAQVLRGNAIDIWRERNIISRECNIIPRERNFIAKKRNNIIYISHDPSGAPSDLVRSRQPKLLRYGYDIIR